MKKKNPFLLLLISTMFLAVGCNSNSNTDDPKQDDPSGEKEDDPTPAVEYWTVNFGKSDAYSDAALYEDDACTKAISDNKVVKGNPVVFKFSLQNADTTEIDSVTYASLTDATGTAATKLSEDGANYVYKIAEVKANITISIKAKAKEVTPPAPTVDAFEVTFELKEHVKDLKVYKSEARDAATADAATDKHYSRDAASGDPVKADGQINFEFKLDSGYQLKSITAPADTYKNIKFLGIKNGVVMAKVTKISADTKITIEAEANTVAHDGYSVTFVKGSHVKAITIYENAGFTAGTEISGLVTKSIEQETGNGTKSKGRVYFIATFDDGYELDAIALNPTDGGELDTDDPENSHVIKKISKDLTVNVSAKATAGGGDTPGGNPEPEVTEEGYHVTISQTIIEGNSWNGKTHLKNLKVYISSKLDAEDEGTTVSGQYGQSSKYYETRSKDSPYAKTKTEGQINFSIETDDGYQIKSVTVKSGTYKNIKFVPGTEGAIDSWRVTKISADTTITITAEAATAGWPVAIKGASVKLYSDETFTTELTNASSVSMDATGTATKTNGNLYFKVSAPHGYTLSEDEPVLNIDGAGSLKAVKGMTNCYKLTGIACGCEVTFKTTRDAVGVPYLYFKSTTKANSYVNGSNIAQTGDTYFVVGPDASKCIAMWFWTYEGEESKEEINICIELTFDGSNVNVVGDPTAQYNGTATDRKEWQHCTTKSFPVVEIASTDIPADFVHYLTLLSTGE